jgi:hypothetical protein
MERQSTDANNLGWGTGNAKQAIVDRNHAAKY